MRDDGALLLTLLLVLPAAPLLAAPADRQNA